MALRDGYCTVDDLLINGTRLPVAASLDAAIASAADEIDSEIGQLYVTPLTLDQNDTTKRDDYLIMKSVNAALASGRLLTAMSAGGEDTVTHNYGMYLIRFAYSKLGQITDGTRILTSAIKKQSASKFNTVRGPKVANAERYSLVDSFYQNHDPRMSQPDFWFTPSDPSELAAEWPEESCAWWT